MNFVRGFGAETVVESVELMLLLPYATTRVSLPPSTAVHFTTKQNRLARWKDRLQQGRGSRELSETQAGSGPDSHA